MSKDDYRIWSNADLDYEEWKDWMEEEYPTLSDDERVAMMYEENGHYLEDERLNLDIQLSQPILVVADLGLWNGRRTGYKEIPSGNIRDCLYSDYDYTTWYVDKSGDLRCDDTHHDGTNHYLYRVYKDNVSQAQKDRLKEKSTTAQPPEQTLPASPAGLAMRSEKCTAGAFQPGRESEVKHDEPRTAERKLYCQTGLFGFQRKSMQQRCVQR